MNAKPTNRLLIVCPEAHAAKGNALALVTGTGPGDANTFQRTEAWRNGERYFLASLDVGNDWLAAAGGALAAPEHSPDADLALAGQAQALLHFYHTAPREAGTDVILVVINPDPVAALELAGLSSDPVA